MTVIEKQCSGNGYYVSMEMVPSSRGGGTYHIEVCPLFDSCHAGYPVAKKSYSLKDRTNALAAYRRYVNKYVKGV